MKKLVYSIFIVLLALGLNSCSGENLYEFEELSQRDDFIIELFVQAENADVPMEFSRIVYKTDGYERLLKETRYFSVVKYEVLNSAVKKHKKVGLTFIPEGNIARFRVRIYNLETGYNVSLQQFEEVIGKTTIFYDFETAEETVIQE